MIADELPEGRHGKPRAVGMLGPHVVGSRVVVRRLLPGQAGPSGGPAMTDVLGTCESWEDGLATVRREDGSLVEIPVADIVSGKPVPPRPSVHRRLGAAQADRLALPGWQPVEREPLGEWVLRASGGFSSRGNSVLALGSPGMPLEQAVNSVTQWYLARSLSPRAHVHPEGPEAESFAEAHWSVYDPTLLMLSSVSRLLRRLGPDQVAEPRHDGVLDEGWLATDERASRFGDDARAVLEAGEVTFATVRDEEEAVLARGRGSFHGDWIGVSSLWTRGDVRGTGLGSAVLESLLAWGAERGATTSYLQVVESNDHARRLYEARGYEVHHRYDYLVADTDPQA
ncbi:MAG: GNAT family N-acetyltransferase [Marmoricola sp.]